jgi:formate dehydrogenase major subunit
LYNRAGVNREGAPWDNDNYAIKWNRSWKGDMVDGGDEFSSGEKNPFTMLPEGVARLFSSSIIDGPLPEYYKSFEDNYPNLVNNLSSHPFDLAGKKSGSRNILFPYAASINGIAEGWRPGISGARVSWLFEMLPDMFCEISPALAEAKGIVTGDKVLITSKFGSVRTTCLVTERMQAGTGTDGMISMIMNTGRETINNNFYNLVNNFIEPFSGTPAVKAFFADIRRV